VSGQVSNPGVVPEGGSSYQGIMTDEKTGETITDVPTVDNAVDTMRSQFGMESAKKVIPQVDDQLASDIRFDMFDNVFPGWGEGADNKLFLMEEGREEKIIHMEPLCQPGSYIGPIAWVVVPPWQHQRIMPPDKVKAYGEERKRELGVIQSTVSAYKERSTNLLGSDVGYPYNHSACELKRRAGSPFEPIIRTDMNWEHVKDPCGYQLNKNRLRLQTDALRYPRQLDSYTNGMRGPTLKKRRGLEVILH
jgi:hypothetical protein